MNVDLNRSLSYSSRLGEFGIEWTKFHNVMDVAGGAGTNRGPHFCLFAQILNSTLRPRPERPLLALVQLVILIFCFFQTFVIYVGKFKDFSIISAC